MGEEGGVGNVVGECKESVFPRFLIMLILLIS